MEPLIYQTVADYRLRGADWRTVRSYVNQVK